MSGEMHAGTTPVSTVAGRSLRTAQPAYQSYVMLYVGFVLVPVVAGVDKFLHLLVDWEQYLAPQVTQFLPVTATTFMLAVGVIETIAGLLVAVRPQFGAYVVALWLFGIIVNLLMIPAFFDIALRDLGLAVGALALARLSREFNPKPLGV